MKHGQVGQRHHWPPIFTHAETSRTVAPTRHAGEGDAAGDGEGDGRGVGGGVGTGGRVVVVAGGDAGRVVVAGADVPAGEVADPAPAGTGWTGPGPAAARTGPVAAGTLAGGVALGDVALDVAEDDGRPDGDAAAAGATAGDDATGGEAAEGARGAPWFSTLVTARVAPTEMASASPDGIALTAHWCVISGLHD